jgi:hypothetical protein
MAALALILVACGRVGFEHEDGGARDARTPDDVSPFDSRVTADAPLPDAALPDAALPDAPLADSSIDDGSAVDAPLDGSAKVDGGERGAIVVSDLRVVWATPNTVRWAWSRTGSSADFARYELVTGPTSADVAMRTASSFTWTAAENPELGLFELTTGGVDPVLATTTDGHSADRNVFAELIAFDRTGERRSVTSSARTTSDATSEIVLFRDADTAGYSLPAELVRSTVMPFSGTHCYRYAFTCGGPDCYENLRRKDIAVPATSMPAAAFGRAFLEFALAIDTAEPSRWSDARLAWNTPTYTSYAVVALVYRANGAYRVYQIPLSAFSSTGGALNHAALTASPIHEFWFGGSWPVNPVVRIDEVRIRY